LVTVRRKLRRAGMDCIFLWALCAAIPPAAPHRLQPQLRGFPDWSSCPN